MGIRDATEDGGGMTDERADTLIAVTIASAVLLVGAVIGALVYGMAIRGNR